MEITTDPARLAAASLLMMLGMAGFLAVWYGIGIRLVRRQPLVPQERRPAVPWGGADLILVIGVWFSGQVAMGALAPVFLGAEALTPTPAGNGGEASAQHAVAKLLQQDGRAGVFLLAALMAVVVAPVCEEFLFRLLLQGWLEKMERELRRSWPRLRPLLYPGVLSVGSASWLFAMMHFRMGEESPRSSVLLYLLVASMVVNVSTVVSALAWIRLRRGATWADLGLVPERFGSDVLLGATTFLAIGIPLYGLQYVLTQIVPPSIAPDPLALFPFAIVLGFLYFRTHRIVPSIALHMGLNGTTMLMLGLLMK